MPNEFSKRAVFIKARTPREYKIIKAQGCVIIKKLSTPLAYNTPKTNGVFETNTNIKTNSSTVAKIVAYENKEKETIKDKLKIIPPKTSPFNSGSSFEDFQKQVAKLREEEQNKKNIPENAVTFDSVQVQEKPLTQKSINNVFNTNDSKKENVEVKEDENEDDVEELVSGKISEEQDNLNMEYLNAIEKPALKRTYEVAYGKKPKNLTRYELKKAIIEKYKESSASRKNIIFKATKGV